MKNISTSLKAAAAVVALCGPIASNAATITGANSLANATPYIDTLSYEVGMGPFTRGEMTWSATTQLAGFGSIAEYLFNNGATAPAGTRSYLLLAGSLVTDTMNVKFSAPVSGFLAEVNWNTGPSYAASLTAFDTAGNELETFVLAANGVANVAGNCSNSFCSGAGYYGFSRANADIGRIRFDYGAGLARNLSYVLAVDNAVPEPGTWGMMIFGFAAAGIALRRRSAGSVRAASLA